MCTWNRLWIKSLKNKYTIIIIIIIIPIAIGALGMIAKGLGGMLEKLELEDKRRSSTLQHCWQQPEYQGEFWRPEETCCQSASNERPSTNAGMKNM